jgi:hypothetical protein
MTKADMVKATFGIFIAILGFAIVNWFSLGSTVATL